VKDNFIARSSTFGTPRGRLNWFLNWFLHRVLHLADPARLGEAFDRKKV
jgi:hypothetical protein